VTIRVVTDSSCDLPDALIDALRIEVVPLTIRFAGADGTFEELVDREQLTTDQFWSRLASSRSLPETAAPSAGAFAERFRALFERGATGIVCINLSSSLSATMQSAQLAAASVASTGPVQVIDSRTASMGMGNLCLTAARRAADGDSLESIVAEVVRRRDRTELFATLDTLEFLKRGGRVGNARALLGSVLSIKPLIEVRDGIVHEAGRVRTRSKALRALADRVASSRPFEHLAVLHGNADDVDQLLDLLAGVFPRDDILVGQVGPVIGTHAGPGVIGVSYQVLR
jgi:DegV family protein with EDD domain